MKDKIVPIIFVLLAITVMVIAGKESNNITDRGSASGGCGSTCSSTPPIQPAPPK